MPLTPEWQYRIEHWRKRIPTLWFAPFADVTLSACFTFDQWTAAEAAGQKFAPFPAGTAWGGKWQYAWLKTRIQLPADVAGQRIALDLGTDSECAVYKDGRPFDHRDWAHPLVTLTRKAKAGETFDLLVEAYAGHGATPCGDGPIPFAVPPVPPCPEAQRTQRQAQVGIFHDALYQAWIDFDTLIHLAGNVNPESLRRAQIDQALMDFTVALDVELPLEDLLRQVPSARATLKKCLAATNGSVAPEMYCFGHSHIDVAWLWPLRETESKCTRTFQTALALMDEYPEYKFLQSQPHLYWMVKNKYPDLYKRIQAKAKTGQWIPDGGMWVEPDTNVTGGESLIRQFVHGKRFYKEEFGRDSELMWLPDVFGYSGALPQIMKGCGIKYFSTQKIYWAYNGGDRFPYVTFWWEGIDGTKVLSHFHNDYNALTTPTAIATRWKERPQKMGIDARLYPFGYGDGGGGPTRDHIEYLRRMNDLQGCPRTRIADPVDFFRDEAAKKADLPTYVGELYFQCHRGTYTSQARTKRGNRKSEFGLREAELWAVAALCRAGQKYPVAPLTDMWRAVLLNQFHDIIPGSSIERVYVEAEKAYAEVIEGADRLAAAATAALAPSDKKTKTLSVFNPLSWERDTLVALPEGVAALRDADGQPVATQQRADGTMVAKVRLPSMGAAAFAVADAEAAPAKTAGVKATANSLENAVLRVRFDNKGRITSLYDKVARRECASGPMNDFMMWKDVPRCFDAWDIDSTYMANPVPLDEKATIRVLDQGALVARLEIARRLHNSTVKQIVSLEAGAQQVTFETVIDWHERHKLLKVAFPFALHTDRALHEIQFGHLARPNHENRQFDRDQFEVACQKWSALVEDQRGGAVLNDGKYGVSARGNDIRLTLLKAPLQPDANADQGEQHITYAVRIWEGAFGEEGPVRPAYELNAPARVTSGGASFSLMAVEDAPSVVVETVKAAEDGSGDVVVRLYESARRATEATLRLGFEAKTWRETDMLENGGTAAPVKKDAVSLTFRPFEIKTVRLSR